MDRLLKLLRLGRAEEARAEVRELLKKGYTPAAIIAALSEELKEIGEEYERGKLFLTDLMAAGHVMDVLTRELTQPMSRGGDAETSKGTVILGTVEGDIHDIGIRIVEAVLKAAGFKVVNIGRDKKPREFVEAAVKHKAQVIGVSALLTTTMPKQKEVIEELEKAGIRGKVKVIVGGAPVTEKWAKQIGADAYAADAMQAVQKIEQLLKQLKQQTSAKNHAEDEARALEPAESR